VLEGRIMDLLRWMIENSMFLCAVSLVTLALFGYVIQMVRQVKRNKN